MPARARPRVPSACPTTGHRRRRAAPRSRPARKEQHVARALDGLHAALQAIADGATVISLFPLAVCCAAIAVLAFRTRALPRWVAAGAGITAVALAVNGAFIQTTSVPAMLLFVLWTLLASGYLTFQAWRGRAAVPLIPARAPGATETAGRV